MEERMSVNAISKTIRPGDTSKSNPFTIIIVSNPALEAPWNSGIFTIDPITSNQAAFDACVRYIDDSLFGKLPNQRERFMSDPAIEPKIQVLSLFVSGLPAQDLNSLAAQDGVSNMLVARRAVFTSFLAGFGLNVADVVYAVSGSLSHNRASAWFTSDDDAGPGNGFTLDGVTLSHRHFNLVPGTVALHSTTTSLTAMHEFGHALSSYTNGSVVDLYVDSRAGLNNKRGRPIPPSFSVHNGSVLTSDAARNGLTYPAGWQSYHCELLDPSVPALMDNYWYASTGVPEHCRHDKITRQFLGDRLRAKIGR
jgi:hypothetical protein